MEADTPSALRYRRAFTSRALVDDRVPPSKPWLSSAQRARSDRLAYWIFVLTVLLGVCACSVFILSGYLSVPRHRYCLVLEDKFSGGGLDASLWRHEVEVGGFGNGQFDMTTASANNSYVADGRLFLRPTLTVDALPDPGALVDGWTIDLLADGSCTASNRSAANCVARSSSSSSSSAPGNSSILPPIQSARIASRQSITFGRVQVRARLPAGDWIWPAIWMLPADNVYGAWPRSGEIDIVESKGNRATRRADNLANAMRSALHFGPNWAYDGWRRKNVIRKQWRGSYSERMHTFGLEWTPEGLWTWEGSRVHRVLSHRFTRPFWSIGGFPSLTGNGTVLADPWGGSHVAPFDQAFYLLLSVGVGGTNGYFDDGDAERPWSNGASVDEARAQFWRARERWLPTWGADGGGGGGGSSRAMEVESVRMWQLC